MTYNTPNSVWTEQRVEQLKALWADELTYAGIAAALGGGISRTAVAGKVYRLGLIRDVKIKRPRAPRTIRKVGNTSYVPRDEEADQATDVASVTELEAQPKPATFLGIAIIDLEPRHCRYIRAVDGQTLYCGQPKIEGSSYCAECHRRCHSRERYLLNARRAA